MTGLESRGYRPLPGERSLLSAMLQVELARMFRRRMAIDLIHGNSWSGWLENGNPHGDPRPGPVTVPRGLDFLKIG